MPAALGRDQDWCAAVPVFAEQLVGSVRQQPGLRCSRSDFGQCPDGGAHGPLNLLGGDAGQIVQHLISAPHSKQRRPPAQAPANPITPAQHLDEPRSRSRRRCSGADCTICDNEREHQHLFKIADVSLAERVFDAGRCPVQVPGPQVFEFGARRERGALSG